MLEQMRKHSQSLLIYVLFGIVIAVFIINFGPQSAGGCGPQTGLPTASWAAKVEGRVITPQDFRYGYMLAGGGQAPPQMARARRLKETIMDRLVERELLAAEAQRLGFRVGEDEVTSFVADARVLSFGFEQSLEIVKKDGKFDYDLFRRFAQYQLGLSPKGFLDQQRRELAADRVRQLLKAGVTVSVAEIKTDFVRRGNQANVEYVRFPVRRYESEIEPTEKEVEAYAKESEEKLKKVYEERKFLYEKAPKERRLRQLQVKLDAGASPDAEQAAQKKAEALAERVRKGEPFAKVAKEASDDARTKARGGQIGWRRQGATTLGAPNEEKVWAAKDGELVGPLKAADGIYLVFAEATREGDIPFDKVKLELAEDQLRQDKAKSRARAEAEAALAKARGAAGKTLKEIFPPPSDKASASGTETSQAEETGLFARRGAVVEGIGTSPELAKSIFELTSESPFAGPIEVAGSYVIVKLKERKQPDMAEFEKKKLELQQQAAAAKGEEIVAEWALRRCQEAKEQKRIDVNREILRYEGGPEGLPAYEPCSPPQMRF